MFYSEGGEVVPSQTFLNLDNEKKNKLIAAARDEFSNHLYSDVSINQIINTAKIPRGSFYMYFNDKDDLFEYLIDIDKNKLHEVTKECFIENHGDLYNSFLALYDKVVKYVVENNYYGIMKNVFIFFDMRRGHFHKPGYALYQNVKDLINLSNLKNDELEFIFIMLVHHLFMTVTYCINNDCLDDRAFFVKKLHILCYGIYK